MTDPADPNRELYASGLENVPIQVWTTKAFHAQWTAPIDPAKPPISAELSVAPADEQGLVGTITNNLPIEKFSDVALFWRGKAFDLGTDLPTGVPRAVSGSVAPGSGEPQITVWLNDGNKRGPVTTPYQSSTGYPYQNAGTTENPIFRLWPVLFTDAAVPGNLANAPNASLRRLDQSWRVGEDRPEQAILVLRIPTRETPAEDMAQSPESPSRLWLGELPTSGGIRPGLQGTLKQETYVRVFIPVKPAPTKK
jgi:hypothetical protein